MPIERTAWPTVARNPKTESGPIEARRRVSYAILDGLVHGAKGATLAFQPSAVANATVASYCVCVDFVGLATGPLCCS